MNTANNLFKSNLPLRQAVNYAISRRPYVAQAGPYAGQPWTHLFNPGVPGWRNVSIYKQNMTKAKSLARGHMKDGKITVYYRSSGTVNPAQYQIVKSNLEQIGFDVTGIGWPGGEIYTRMGHRGEPFDLGVIRTLLSQPELASRNPQRRLSGR